MKYMIFVTFMSCSKASVGDPSGARQPSSPTLLTAFSACAQNRLIMWTTFSAIMVAVDSSPPPSRGSAMASSCRMIVSSLWMSYLEGRRGSCEMALPTSSMVTLSANMYSRGAQRRSLEAFKKAICIRKRPFWLAWPPCKTRHSGELKTTDIEVLVLEAIPPIEADASPSASPFLTIVQLSALAFGLPARRLAPSLLAPPSSSSPPSTTTRALHCKNGSSRAADPPSIPVLDDEEDAAVSSREAAKVDPETPAACMVSWRDASMFRVAERVAG
mmetsp:Transcript_12119/g.25651  ORF Transcript_12119/g.25651 Transcript_12119/m.25651 type:complete len:273 (-) Transcript_12119:397-1215(-)